jgi:hypothetical protein
LGKNQRSAKEIHAMDRRRYVPAAEGMECRTMLSVTPAAAALTTTPFSERQALPVTVQQKLQRIERVPNNLRSLDQNRFLPADLIEQIQLGLEQLISRLDRPSSVALTNYNLALRGIVFGSSISTRDAQLLDAGFRGVLKSAKAPAESLETLASAVNTLVTQVDTASRNPTFLATNDHAYLLQLALAVGQPMPAPRAPTIETTSGAQTAPGRFVTPLPNPAFTGNYERGTTIQLLDIDSGAIVGTAAVAANGQYRVRVETPLEAGTTHRFRVRAVDEAGHLSRESREFVVRVVAPKNPPTILGQPVPRGPRHSSR